MHLMNVFCECMHIYYCMEINILMTEMLLTHGVVNISRVVRTLQQESCKSSSHMSIDYRKFFCSEKEVMNLLIVFMNMCMHRMIIHSI
jgi:hypothetical protein